MKVKLILISTIASLCMTLLKGQFINNKYPCQTVDPSGEKCSECLIQNEENRYSMENALNSCKCIEDDFYFYYDSNPNDMGCKRCDDYSILSINKDLHCQTCKQLDFENNKLNRIYCLSCKRGYYMSEEVSDITGYTQCEKCHNSCQTCDSFNECIICKEGLRRQDNGLCDCPDSQFFLEGECKNCEYPCQTCQDFSSNCISCVSETNRKSAEEGCLCEKGYYDDDSRNACRQCYFGCKVCQGPHSCLECHHNRDVDNNCKCYRGFKEKEIDGKLECISDIVVFDPHGTEEQKQARCMYKAQISTSRIQVDHCQVCRPDKNIFGKILVDDQSDEDTQVKKEFRQENLNGRGTYGLRVGQTSKGVYFKPMLCETARNEDKDQVYESYEQEKKIEFCDMYDHYGECIYCMSGYSLKWKYQNSDKEGESQIQQGGNWECVSNVLKTQYCHEFDSKTGKCKECKWNQNALNTRARQMYKQSKEYGLYSLDYGMYEYNDEVYCIFNRRLDDRMKFIDPSFKEEDLVEDCKKYDPKTKKCIECHSMQFVGEGSNRWRRTTYLNYNFQYASTEYWLNEEKNKCLKYPSSYITQPEYLRSWKANSKNHILEGKCFDVEGRKAALQKDANVVLEKLWDSNKWIFNQTYGCAPIVEGCTSYSFRYDHDYMNKYGKFYKKFDTCLQCNSSYTLNKESGVCQGRIENCVMKDNTNNCVECDTEYELYTQNAASAYQCIRQNHLGVPQELKNCRKDKLEYDQLNDRYIRQCQQCNQGYLIQQIEGQQICVYYSVGKENKGCFKVDQYNQCVDLKGKQGFDTEGRCESDTMTRIDSLCLINGLQLIDNCEQAIKVYDYDIQDDDEDGIRCFKCQEGYYQSESWAQCYRRADSTEQDNGYVHNCNQYDQEEDGNWCVKCRENVRIIENGVQKFVNYILTSENTCVRERGGWIGKNCAYAVYSSQNYRLDNKLKQCKVCRDGYHFDEHKNCVKQEQLGGNEGSILLFNKIEETKGILTDNCKYYRDTQGNCYECMPNYGVITNNGKQICNACGAGFKQLRGASGEKVCATPVPHCYMYHQLHNYCIMCESHYHNDENIDYVLNANGNSIECIPQESCTASLQTEAFSQSQVCVQNTDPNCSSGLYEFYSAVGEDIRPRLRCAQCDRIGQDLATNYFINASQTVQLCTPYTEMNLEIDLYGEDNPFVNTRVWQLNLEDPSQFPSVPNNMGPYQNSPCQMQFSEFRQHQEYHIFWGVNVQVDRFGYTDKCQNVQQIDNYVENCMQFNQLSSLCYVCYPGFILSDDKQHCLLRAARPYLNLVQYNPQPDYQKNCFYYSYTLNSTGYSQISNCLKCEYGHLSLGLKEGEQVGRCTESPHPACTQIQNSFLENQSCGSCQHPFHLIALEENENKFTCKLLPKKGVRMDKYYSDWYECEVGYQWFEGQCRQKMENCLYQRFDMTYDYGVKKVKNGYCSVCMHYMWNNIIKMQKDGSLFNGCDSGCKSRKRQMRERSPDNQQYLYSCDKCRNEGFHKLNGEDRCVAVDKIENCEIYKQDIVGWNEQCERCKVGYYINQDGQCSTCDTQNTHCFDRNFDQYANSTLEDGKCRCTKCEENYALGTDGSCTHIDNSQHNACTKYNDVGQCIQCHQQGEQYFLNLNKECQEYTVDHCEEKDPKDNKCIKCDTESDNYNFLDQYGHCVQGGVQHCQIFRSQGVCELCQEQYGLRYDRQECMLNAIAGEPHCYLYEENIDPLNEEYRCMDCRNSLYEKYTTLNKGYAPNRGGRYRRGEFCLQINYCYDAFIHDDQIYCSKCIEVLDYTRIFSTDTQFGVCVKEPKNLDQDSIHVQYCKQYLRYDQNGQKQDNVCMSCHEGFHGDYDGVNYGRVCISDDHPGALPGCKYYARIDNSDQSPNDPNYIIQKYESLKCRECYDKYQYYSYIEKEDKSIYGINSYGLWCDIIGQNSPQLPSSQLYHGKDGGIISINSKNDDDKREPGRDTYISPKHTYGNILHNCIQLLILIIFIYIG